MRVAVISAHTSPLARPGGNKTGGLNVYVRGLAQQLVAPRLPAGRQGCQVDIFSRAASPGTPELTELAPGLRVIHLRAGPARFLAPESVYKHLDAFEQALLDFNQKDGATYDLIHSHYWLSGLVGERLKAESQ